ncbi:MAG: phosphatidylglycerophosphatase A [Saprospiraceae bacterium]|nr:phosphatidylglycerophosphatase A [Saprospiraceae bacterium]MDW8484842.1 phosphatidylglycerophosphatase A [Saprospiraceae bacterium]
MNGSKNLRSSWQAWVLCGFGIGWLPLAPGTWAAALAALIAAGIEWLTPTFFPLVVALAVGAALGVGLANMSRIEAVWGKDPAPVVLDEMAGMWAALWVAPPEWWAWVAVFFLFRFFDIVKPLGIRHLEKLPHGWGVMLDDIAAGIYACISWQVFWWAYR